jgi:hypothetical protein
MRPFLVLNAFTVTLMAVAMIAAARDDRFFEVLLVGFVFLLGLAIMNLVAPLLLWKQHRLRGLIPPALLAAAVASLLLGAGPATRFAQSGTPLSPETFLTGARKQDLEGLASDLFAIGMPVIEVPRERSAGTINDPPGVPGGYRAIEERLRRQGFNRVTAIDSAGIVLFHRHHGRMWHDYAFAARPLTIEQINAYSGEFGGPATWQAMGPHWFYRSW